MIGDNFEADICGAARIGMAQIYFNPDNRPLPCRREKQRTSGCEESNPRRERPVACPTYQVSSLEEIISIL